MDSLPNCPHLFQWFAYSLYPAALEVPVPGSGCDGDKMLTMVHSLKMQCSTITIKIDVAFAVKLN